MQKTFILIDGHALIYRAYHAFKELSTSEGLLVNAVYGFTRAMLTVIRDFNPEYIAVTFDHPTPTFRHAEYIGYKASREKMPDDLIAQISLIKDMVTAFNIPQYELPGYEADDLIGTLSRQIKEISDMCVVIVTGDRDSFQLVDEKVHVWMPGRAPFTKDTEYDPQQVVQKMGVKPSQIIDLKALMGDASDCIPGIKGVGEKTAVKLIQEFGSVDAIYETIQKENLSIESSTHPLLKGNLLKKLAEGHQDAILSKSLATIDQYVPITIDVEACKTTGYKKEDVVKMFEKYQFKSLLKFLPADDFEMEVQGALF